MFDYDWFYGKPYEQQKKDALIRVAMKKFPKKDRAAVLEDDACRRCMDELECRTLIYLRDGFSYEVKALASEVDSKVHLTFECEPADDLYKAGSFVVAIPFDEVCRVEVFAVHPEQKPENKPMITGFRHSPSEEGRG